MENSTIGIKIADGTYYPIIEGDSLKKKKLILTTVYDDQGSVQIDLFRGRGQEIDDAQYVGSLVIEDIMPGGKGEPEIELVVGVDQDGNLNAVAGDVGAGEKQSLSVSLESLDEAGFDSPNFELDDKVFDDEESDDEDLGFDDALDLGDDETFDELSEFDDDSFSAGEDAFEDMPVFDEEIPGAEQEIIEEEAEVSSGQPDFDDEEAFSGLSEFDDDSFTAGKDAFEDMPAFDEEIPGVEQSMIEEEAEVPFGQTAFDDEETFDDLSELDDGSFTAPSEDFEDMPVFDEDADQSVFDEQAVFDEEPEAFAEIQSFDSDSGLDEDFEDDGFSSIGSESGFDTDEEDAEPVGYKKRRNPLALAVLVIIILILAGLGIFMVLRGADQESVPPLAADSGVGTTEVQTPDKIPEAEVREPETAVPEKALPEKTEDLRVSSVDSSTLPPEGRGGGVWYRLKWGDTLWNLSISFYRTPWLYGLIAVENGIKNPDIIYAGTDLFIPEN